MTLVATYLLQLTAPVVVTVPSGDVNSANSSPYLPGRAMRGAVASQLHQAANPSILDALIKNGTVRFLPAYPSIDAARSSPTPLSWRCKKSDLGNFLPPVFDLGGGPIAGGAELGLPPFALVGGARWNMPVSSNLETTIHIARSSRARRGRPVKGDGAVFSYEAIPAGTDLHLAVVLPNECIAEQLDQVLTENDLRLGRSAAAGYGGWPKVEILGRLNRELLNCPWRVDADLEAGGTVRVLLTSDAIVRNQTTGQPDPSALGAAIETASGAKLKEIPDRRWVRSDVVAGFDNTWRLALPQVRAAVAGSVLEFEVVKDMTKEEVITLENRGIGERRPDGHGALVFLNHLDDVAGANAFSLVIPTAAQLTGEPVGDAPDEIKDLHSRILEAAVTRALIELGHDLANAATGVLPQRSLVGRLQNALRADLGNTSPTHLLVMLEQMAPRARKQLEKCRVEDKDLHSWITEVLNADVEAISAKLERTSLWGRLVSSAILPDELKLRPTANAMLVSATLVALARQTKQTPRTSDSPDDSGEPVEQDAATPVTKEAK